MSRGFVSTITAMHRQTQSHKLSCPVSGIALHRSTYHFI